MKIDDKTDTIRTVHYKPSVFFVPKRRSNWDF